jgi:hypothetical protein
MLAAAIDRGHSLKRVYQCPNAHDLTVLNNNRRPLQDLAIAYVNSGICDRENALLLRHRINVFLRSGRSIDVASKKI